MTHQNKRHAYPLSICSLLAAAAVVASAQPARTDKIAQEVRDRARSAGPIPVFVVLTRQPHPGIISRVRAGMAPRVRSAENDDDRLALQSRASAQLEATRVRLEALRSEERRQSMQLVEADIRPDQDQVEDRLRALGATGVQRYTILNMLRADVPAAALAALEADPMVAAVSLVQQRVPQIKESVSFLWFGVSGRPIPQESTGAGQTVAILDTGLKTNHPAFRELKAAPNGIPGKTFLTHLKRDECFNDDALSLEDRYGHGTLVAGIVASRGGSNVAGGTDWSAYKGVAPGARLLILKVAGRLKTRAENLNCSGSAGAEDDDLLEAIQWTLTNLDTASTNIFNFSLSNCRARDARGNCTHFDEDNALSQILDSIADFWGLTFIGAAGNEGVRDIRATPPDCTIVPRTVGHPGIAYNLISVANLSIKIRPADTIAPRCPDVVPPAISATSSRGPTAATAAYPVGRRKPDIAAPGTYIYSTAFNWDLQASQQRACNGNALATSKNEFVCSSGTSMAAPHIAGAVAVLQSRADFRPVVPDDCTAVARAAYPLSAKALLLNAATFAPTVTGWVPDAGWGWASLSTAVDHLKLNAAPKAVLFGSCVEAPPLNPPPGSPRRDVRFFKGQVQASAAKPFKATLVWNRHVAWDLVNKQPYETPWTPAVPPVAPAEPSHLRLRLYDAATNAPIPDPVPPSDPRDNVQQILSRQAGLQVIKVYREAGFGPPGQELFSLATSQALEPANVPELALECNPGGIFNPLDPPRVVCTITNRGDLPLFNLLVQADRGGTCHRMDDTKLLDSHASDICSMTSPGGPITVTASGVFADDTYRTSTAFDSPRPVDCHGVTLKPSEATVGPAGGSGFFDVIFPDPEKCSIRDVSTPPNGMGWIRLTPGSAFGRVLYSVQPLNFPPQLPPPPSQPRTSAIEVLLQDYSHLAFRVDQTSGPAPPAADVTGVVGIAPGAFRLDRTTNRFVQTIRLTNHGAVAIKGPVSLALDGLPAGVTLFNASGSTSAAQPASPYLNAGGDLGLGAFVDVTAEFVNPSKGAIRYNGRVLSGSNR